MLKENRNPLWLALGLVVAIIATRAHHFGNTVSLPDATLAILFIGGMTLRRGVWLALMTTSALLMDVYALDFQGVSDYCMSPAYWGLIPTYALVWLMGSKLAQRADKFAVLPYAFSAWLATSLAFVVSNAFFYAFSGRFTAMSVAEYASRVAQYYTPYVGYALMYLGVAWAVAKALSVQTKSQARLA